MANITLSGGCPHLTRCLSAAVASLTPSTNPSARGITNHSANTGSALLDLEATLFEFQGIDLGLGASRSGGGVSVVLGEAELSIKAELCPVREESTADGVGEEEFVDAV